MDRKEIASLIDHTLLAPNAGIDQIVMLCQEAERYGFASVCVNPCYVSAAATQLVNSSVKICTVIGFPFGSITTDDKVVEAVNAINNGADEIDMVINIGNAKDGLFSKVGAEIADVVKASKEAGKNLGKNIIVKVIIETCLLTDDEIVNCSLCAKKANADFVKTSTGFATPKGIDGNLLPNGASEYQIKLIRKTVGPEMGIKASGGIRSARMAKSMIEAGATRIGTSSGVIIVENWTED